ncbi:dual adapter for phosphotyrosine and 3-phosphotyrosine and 3-phosphoinositide [Anaeramoeba flamelloides]|uniref:Dual adapter for phosphotyrosine and 3-phosphotyrosine and 3-phosphoinositide n=1 Tax=Anaeramoeba flamelloides TaxID=1746091 RepID=A0AAV7YIJ3_9EUKA|nr:dual adapter for phosphotyrosine and 3-phosphotyrosine and 3-phosphoinositide [Anaeramoeba flamelloides]
MIYFYRDIFSRNTLNYFLRLFQFQHITLADALRDFLGSVKIPLDIDVIEQCFWQFGISYQIQNQGLYSDINSVIVIAFRLALIIPSDKRNPFRGISQFQKFCKEISGNEKIPIDRLTNCYLQVIENPLPFFNSYHSGYLLKQCGAFYGLKQRWVDLSFDYLFTYKNENSTIIIETIPLADAIIEPLKDNLKKKTHAFSIDYTSSQNNTGTTNKSTTQNVILVAETQQELERWLKKISECKLILNCFDRCI